MFESKPKKHKNAKLKSRSYVFLFAISIYALPCIENLENRYNGLLTKTTLPSCFANIKILNKPMQL